MFIASQDGNVAGGAYGHDSDEIQFFQTQVIFHNTAIWQLDIVRQNTQPGLSFEQDSCAKYFPGF